MKIFLLAMVLCVLQCQAKAGRRQISPDDGDLANGSVKRQISTDDLITTSNRPGDIVSGGGKARRDELLPPGVIIGPSFARSRNRNPPYGYGRQDSLDNMTPNGGKRRKDDGYPPDDPEILRYRYPWNSPYGNGRQDADDVMAIPNGGERKRRRDDDMAMYDPYGRPWNSPYGYGRQEFPDEMMPPNSDRKRRRDDLYPPDVMTDPQIRYGRPRYPPYGYWRQDPDDMITSPAGYRKRRRDEMYPPDAMIDPRATRYSRPWYQPNGYGRQGSLDDMITALEDMVRASPGSIYSTDDMNTSPNRPWDTRPRNKRNFPQIPLPLLRNNKMTAYLISKLKLMKDMFDYYEWDSLAAMVSQWIVSLKEQQKETEADAQVASAAPAAPVDPGDPDSVPPPSDDDDQFYPYGKNTRPEMMPGWGG